MRSLLFDLLKAQPYHNTKFHGGGEYIKTVFQNLTVSISPDIAISVFYDSDKYLDQWVIDIIEENSLNTYDIKNNVGLMNLLRSVKFDVFFSGMPDNYTLKYCPRDLMVIGTKHGLSNIEKSNDRCIFYYFSRKNIFSLIIKMALPSLIKKRATYNLLLLLKHQDVTICVSDHTKYAILQRTDTDLENLLMLYSPHKYVAENGSKVNTHLINGKYLLLLGVDRWEKNSVRAIIAFEQLIASEELFGYKFVLVGKIPFFFSMIMRHRERYINIDYADPTDLENLYRNCDIFIFPSLNEGFGYPPLEAMKYGRTCIVSAVCSLTEVCGAVVYYFNPYDVDEIANRILHAANEKIDPRLIVAQYEKIKNKQENDLDKLCALLWTKGKFS
ncbi:mannosyltransferase [Clostridia bacterium]|nr:mannosyltransferase [Clostridia bacterium]